MNVHHLTVVCGVFGLLGSDRLLQLSVYSQGQAVAQLCSTVPNVTVFGIASCFKHAAIRDSVTHLFDRNVDYVQEVKK